MYVHVYTHITSIYGNLCTSPSVIQLPSLPSVICVDSAVERMAVAGRETSCSGESVPWQHSSSRNDTPSDEGKEEEEEEEEEEGEGDEIID